MGKSEYIFGLHEPGGEHLFREAGRSGWIVFTHELGHDPRDANGFDYSPWADLGVVARLNHGYYPNGTIPEPELYPQFATRVGNWVGASRGCHVWIVGNEPNHSQERPNGRIVTPDEYALCYAGCRNAIKALPGHEDDEVVIAAIAPWNVESGDWLEYFERALGIASNLGGVDAIAVHTYTHGTSPDLIFSKETMDPPYGDRFYNFIAYRDFMDRIPSYLRHVPVYVTETDQTDPWRDENTGWVRRAYREIDDWNGTHGNQKIRCLCLYRWPPYDEWVIEGKQGVIDDLEAAMENDYRWKENDAMQTIYEDSFENGFEFFGGVSELEGPVGWGIDWVPGEKPGPVRPEVKPEIEGRDKGIRTGKYGVKFAHAYAFFDACLFKSFEIAEGRRYQARVWATAESGGGLACQVGIDPFGGADFQSDEVVWSEWYGTDDPEFEPYRWGEVIAQAQAQGDTITVFVRCACRDPVKTNAGFLDDFTLEGESGGEPSHPPGVGLQAYVDAIQKDVDLLQDDLDALKIYIGSEKRTCILVE